MSTISKRAIIALAHKGENFALAARIVTDDATQEDAREAKRLTDPSRAKKVRAHDALVSALALAALGPVTVEWDAEMVALAEVEAKREAEVEARKWGHYVNYHRFDSESGKWVHGNGRVKTNHLRPSQVEKYLRAHCKAKGWKFLSVGSPCKQK